MSHLVELYPKCMSNTPSFPRMLSLTSVTIGRTSHLVARRLLALAALLVCAQASAFDFEDVGRRAAALAAQSYKAPAAALPKALQDLSYDQYRDIRFKPAKALWRSANLPFEVQLFHPGLYYDLPVRISEIVGGAAREIRFDPDLFDYGGNKLDPQRLARRGLRGLPRALRAQQSEVPGRGAGVPGRELLPRARPRPALRPVGARPGRRHRSRLRRGVSPLRRVLDRAARRGRQGTHDLRSARFEARHRRVSLRAAAGQRDADAREGARVPARERDEAGARAADEHVLTSARTSTRRRATTGPRSTTPTCC